MVIDFHLHATPRETLLPHVVEWAGRWHEDPESFIDRTHTPEALTQILIEHGVDYGVCLAEYNPTSVGIATNDYMAEFCRKSDRLIPFACVNPFTMPKPAKELVRAVVELGCRGLKLFPPYQYFYPNDPIMYPVYEKAQELGIPVMYHTGISLFKGSRLKYADPILIDDVAVDFPEMNIVLAHSGRGFWYEAAFALARIHEHVYLELSGLPPQKLLTYFPDLDRLGDKLIFGSDWPGLPSIKDNIAAIRALPLSERTKAKFLGENAARLLRLA